MNYIKEEEIFTFKDFILILRVLIKYLHKKKWLIIGSILLGAVLFLYNAYRQPITYTAKMTFVVKKNNTLMGASASGILGQLGFNRSSMVDGVNLDRLLEYIKSEKIIQSALFRKVKIAGEEDLLANYLLTIYEEEAKEWVEIAELESSNFKFDSDKISEFTLSEQILADQLFFLLAGEDTKLITLFYGEDTNILTLLVNSIDENLSIAISRAIYQELSEFYISNATDGSRQLLSLLNTRADSVRNELSHIENKLAKNIFLNEGFISNKEQTYRKKLSRQAQFLSILYGEVLRNKESTAFLLQNQTPFFQIIDRPHRPIIPKSPSKILAIISGGILGFVVCIICFLTKWAFQKVKSI